MSVEVIKKYRDDLVQALLNMDIKAVDETVHLLWKAYENGKQVFIFGNGGSAATASHMACDLGKGIVRKNKKRLIVQSLCDNVAIMTAWANDESYESIFKEQLENVLNEGDVVIGISASGNSPNIIHAVQFAKDKGAKVIGMSGFSGGKLNELADVKIYVPLDDYGQVEDYHLICEHIITESFKRLMCNG